MTEKPIISIIIPCYNSENTIEDCINSIPISMEPEIIIVDDCSADNSVNIVKNIIREKGISNAYLYENIVSSRIFDKRYPLEIFDMCNSGILQRS